MPNSLMPPPSANGAGALVSALMGGDTVANNAQIKREMLYDQQDSGRAELDRKITQALLDRDKRNAQQALPGAYQRQLGVDEAGGVDLANLSLGGVIDNIGQAQEFDMKRRAEAALRSEHQVTDSNAILAALAGKPLEHVDLQDGHVIANRYSEAPVIDLTEIGEADVRAKNALTADRLASAELDRTKTAAGGFAPGAAKPGIVNTAPGVYDGGGSKAIEQAKAIIDDLVAGGGDRTGISARSVVRDMKDDGHVALPPNDPGRDTMRWITGDSVRDIPLAGVAPAPAPAAAAPPAAAIAHLRANPQLAAQFEAKYGVPAAQFLTP